MLFMSHRNEGSGTFPDINASGINEFYYSNIDFDKDYSDAKRFVAILDKLDELLGRGKRPKLRAHDAMHLVLFVDSLWDDYTRSWESTLPKALDRFSEEFASAKSKKDIDKPDEFWIRYGQWTRVNSDRGERIAYRHAFYMEKMFEYLGGLHKKDPQRAFGVLEREIIFFRSHKKCAVCRAQVSWPEAEIHHVVEHSQGGETRLNNGALVHKVCHPKGHAATKQFAEKFLSSQSVGQHMVVPETKYGTAGYLWKYKNSKVFLPHGSDVRMSYKGKDHIALVEGNDLIYNGSITTPATLANNVAGHSRNAWRDLWIKFPNDDTWILADDLRGSTSSVTLDELDL
jgi:5-methylcytosine-specific restriction endonuclease McrA